MSRTAPRGKVRRILHVEGKTVKYHTDRGGTNHVQTTCDCGSGCGGGLERFDRAGAMRLRCGGGKLRTDVHVVLYAQRGVLRAGRVVRELLRAGLHVVCGAPRPAALVPPRLARRVLPAVLVRAPHAVAPCRRTRRTTPRPCRRTRMRSYYAPATYARLYAPAYSYATYYAPAYGPIIMARRTWRANRCGIVLRALTW